MLVRFLLWYNRQESGHSALELLMPTCGVLSSFTRALADLIFLGLFKFFRGRVLVAVIAVVYPYDCFIAGEHLPLGYSESAGRGADYSMCRTLIKPTFFLPSLIYVLIFLSSKPFSF